MKSTTTTNRKAKIVEKDDSSSDEDVQTSLAADTPIENDGHGHSHSGGSCSSDVSKEPKIPQSPIKKTMKFLLLFSMVPVLFTMPFILRKAGEIVSQNRALLFYIWAVYGTIWAALVYSKRKSITLNSFINHNLIWMIIALGTFILLDIPKMIQQVDLRREVLLVWCSITWIPNIIIFYFDDTDHKTKERLEEEKDKRKQKKDEERRVKQEEKRKKRQKERMSKYTPMQRFVYNALIYLGITLLVALLAWQTYRWYLKTQQNIIDRQRSQHISVDEEQEPVYGEYD